MSLKTFLLYSPLLWFRKLLLYALSIAIILGLLVYFLANSPLVVKKLADTFAPDYNISYRQIHGNFISGVEIEDLSYNQHPLLEHLGLKWNPSGLVRKEIIVNHIEIEEANVDTIKAFIAVFDSSEADTNSTKSTQEDADFDFKVSIYNINASVLPFVEQDIEFKSLALKANRLEYENNYLNLKSLSLSSDFNMTQIDVKSIFLSLKDVGLDVKKLLAEKGKVNLEADTDLSGVAYKGNLKKNQLNGHLTLEPKKKLFEKYDLPVSQKSIGDLLFEVNASKEKVFVTLHKQMKQLLKAEKGAFNLDVKALNTTAMYRMKTGIFKADTKLLVDTPYAKNIAITNVLTFKDEVQYKGEVSLKKLIGVDAKLVKPLNDLTIAFIGTDHSIKTQIKSSMFKGHFNSSDFKTADFHLESKEALILRDYLSLPAELNASKVTLSIDAPLDFDSNATMYTKVKLGSNIVNIDANASYKKELLLTSQIDIPEKSLLKAYSKEVHWEKLSPLKLNVKIDDTVASMNVKSDAIYADAKYGLNSKKIEGMLKIVGLETKISGMTDKTMTVHTYARSISELLQSLQSIYTLKDMPKVEGSVDLNVEVEALKKVNLALNSPKIIYHTDKTSSVNIDDVNVLLSMEEGNIVLKKYQVTYDKQKIFATKPSKITYKEDKITLASLWVNDQLKVDGSYDLKQKKGNMEAKASSFGVKQEIIDLSTNINIKTLLDANSTSVKGKVVILGGDIHYDLDQKSFASDSDIIIVQNMKKEKESPFMDNLGIDVQVQTKKALRYKQGPINLKIKVNLGINKAIYSDFLVLGSVEIPAGGSYIFENKKFVLKKSFVYFTGNPNKPLLDIKVNYTTINHLITIAITGSADAPNINFSSKPSLTKEEILSVILFDSTEGAGTNSGEDMMRMMGGAMAKSALSDFGIKLDHLVLGDNGSIEVGKKLTNKITAIYINGDIPKVKLEYQHGRSTQSVIEASEVSQSYDIVYKKRF